MKMDRFCLELRYSLIRQPPRDFAEPKVDGSSNGWVETPAGSESGKGLSA